MIVDFNLIVALFRLFISNNLSKLRRFEHLMIVDYKPIVALSDCLFQTD